MSHNFEICVADTSLSTRDSGGDGRPIVFLNGAFSTQKDWLKVQDLLPKQHYRFISFDYRGRGKSKTSKEYSFSGCLKDLMTVIEKTDVHQPLFVGWSYGAALAVRYAALNPHQTAGLVLVDGAFP